MFQKLVVWGSLCHGTMTNQLHVLEMSCVKEGREEGMTDLSFLLPMSILKSDTGTKTV
jgi:hypothetical protein